MFIWALYGLENSRFFTRLTVSTVSYMVLYLLLSGNQKTETKKKSDQQMIIISDEKTKLKCFRIKCEKRKGAANLAISQKGQLAISQ